MYYHDSLGWYGVRCQLSVDWLDVMRCLDGPFLLWQCCWDRKDVLQGLGPLVLPFSSLSRWSLLLDADDPPRGRWCGSGRTLGYNRVSDGRSRLSCDFFPLAIYLVVKPWHVTC